MSARLYWSDSTDGDVIDEPGWWLDYTDDAGNTLTVDIDGKRESDVETLAYYLDRTDVEGLTGLVTVTRDERDIGSISVGDGCVREWWLAP